MKDLNKIENIEKKNTVESKNQVDSYVLFEGSEKGNPRIMFVGNSITWHKPAHDIGWYGDWGMAASAKDKDYVHICMKNIMERYSNASFCIVQAADWERGYKNDNVLNVFSDAKQFKPNVIVTRLSENIPADDIERDLLIESLGKLHKYLSGDNKQVKLIVTSNVFNNKIKDEVLEAYAKRYQAEYVYLDDYREYEENFANEYEHEGVRMHPGDIGMKFIADRILAALDKVLI